MTRMTICALLAGVLVNGATFAAEDRDAVVRRDRKELEESDIWVYNDLESGLERARKTGQPLAVVFR